VDLESEDRQHRRHDDPEEDFGDGYNIEEPVETDGEKFVRFEREQQEKERDMAYSGDKGNKGQWQRENDSSKEGDRNSLEPWNWEALYQNGGKGKHSKDWNKNWSGGKGNHSKDWNKSWNGKNSNGKGKNPSDKGKNPNDKQNGGKGPRDKSHLPPTLSRKDRAKERSSKFMQNKIVLTPNPNSKVPVNIVPVEPRIPAVERNPAEEVTSNAPVADQAKSVVSMEDLNGVERRLSNLITKELGGVTRALVNALSNSNRGGGKRKRRSRSSSSDSSSEERGKSSAKKRG
jgi:hypothetical protein